MDKKKMAGIALSFAMMLPSQAFAGQQGDTIGGIHINNTPSIQAASENDDKRTHAMESTDTNIGMLRVSPDKIIEGRSQGTIERPKIPTEEAQKLIDELSTISNLKDKGQYSQALQKMSTLYKERQDISTFHKWEAVFQNLNGEYDESNLTLEKMFLTFPMDEELKSDDLVGYYTIDNYRNLGEKEKAEQALEKFKESSKDETTKPRNNTLYLFQDFLLDYETNGQTVNKEKLDKTWESIPKAFQRHLNDFYGFDLDELSYIYGTYYNRKDILKSYVERKKTFEDKDTVRKVQEAKRIILSKY